eukprot:3167584-Prymnesium_polylepis.2
MSASSFVSGAEARVTRQAWCGPESRRGAGSVCRRWERGARTRCGEGGVGGHVAALVVVVVTAERHENELCARTRHAHGWVAVAVLVPAG